MKASEIITADSVKRNIDPAKALLSIREMTKNNSGVLMQENNSVLLVRKVDPTSAEIHLFTEDTPLTLAKSVIGFVRRGRELGIKTVYGKADNQGIVELMKRVGLNVEASDLPQYNWKYWSIEGWIHFKRRKRLSQELVESLLHSHTNLVMRESLDDVLLVDNHQVYFQSLTTSLGSGGEYEDDSDFFVDTHRPSK